MDRLHQAKKEYLTSCYGREDMNEILRELEEESKAGGRKFSLMVADIDHFKTYNDKYGHFFGDEILKYFAESLRIHLDDFQNIPIRFGGDEFIMAFPGRSADEVYPLVRTFKENMRAKPFDYKGCAIHVRFSAGIACFPDDGHTWEDVFEKADRAMYFAKRSGRGRITLYRNITGERLAWVAASTAIAIFTMVIVLLNFGHLFVDSTLQAVDELKSAGKKILSEHGKSEAAPLTVETADVSAAAPPPAEAVAEAPPLQVFYLKSGGVIQGTIDEETEREFVVRLKLSNGEGQVKIDKDNVLKIEEM